MINTPFNYTGSKFKILNQILPYFDYKKRNFIDLFTGGGSVYTNVVDKYENIYINDIINDLVLIHKNLITNPDDIVSSVKKLCVSKDDPEGFNNLRNSYNECKTPEKLWALMLCSTNNMMRFNQKFNYNQTFGKRTFNDSTQNKINDFVNHISKYKNKIHFSNKNFYDVEIIENSMIYIDPPYTNTEAGYNSYWSVKLEEKLYDYIINIDKKGESFALSGVLGEHKNGKRSDIIDKLISDGYQYTIIDLNYEKVARNKNSKNSEEILIYNKKYFNIQ